MKDISKWSHKALVEGYERSKKSLANLRERSAEVGERMAEVGTTLAVGAGYSYLKGRYPLQMSMMIPGTAIELAPVVAGVATLAGIGGFAGKWSEMASLAGASCLGAEINFRAYAAGIKGANEARAVAAQNAKA